MANPHAIFDGLSAAFAELSRFAVTVSGQSRSLDLQQETNRQIEAGKDVTSAQAPIPGRTSVPGPGEPRWKGG